MMSQTSQSSASQSFTSVEMRIAFALPVLRTDLFRKVAELHLALREHYVDIENDLAFHSRLPI